MQSQIYKTNLEEVIETLKFAHEDNKIIIEKDNQIIIICKVDKH